MNRNHYYTFAVPVLALALIQGCTDDDDDEVVDDGAADDGTTGDGDGDDDDGGTGEDDGTDDGDGDTGTDDGAAGEPVHMTVTVENVSDVRPFFASGEFARPVGADEPGPAMPGEMFEVQFAAPPGTRLSFATMFAESNDWFFAPDEGGIALFDDSGEPIDGDVTEQLMLWDAGTEIDQEPGTGPDQAPRQLAPNTGAADPNPMVRLAEDELGNLPAVAEVIEARIESEPDNTFTLTIRNVSDDGTLVHSMGTSAVPLSPGAWVVHMQDAPLFTVGTSDRREGLEAIAEDGMPTMLRESLAARSGVPGVLSPGAFAVHDDELALFSDDARVEGLEQLAEDGMPMVLADTFAASPHVDASGTFVMHVDGGGEGPAMAGDAFRFELDARPGDRLSIATMYAESNDLFFAFDGEGLALFDAEGAPLAGDVSDHLKLWDAGTEANEAPGAGPNQAPRQAGSTGTPEDRAVAPVDDGYAYPLPTETIRVVIAVE